MQLGFSQEEQLLYDTARDFLRRQCPISLVRRLRAPESDGHAPELWHGLAEMGWLGLAFPGRYGGGDGSLLDLAILCEAAGEALVPTTLHSTLASGLLLLNLGSEAQKQALLPRLAAGELLLSLALAEPGAHLNPCALQTRVSRAGGGYVLTGTKLFVANAHLAHALLVVARTQPGAWEQGLSVLLVDRTSPGVSCEPLQTLARDRQSSVRLERITVGDDAVLGMAGGAWPALQRTLAQATALLCAEMVGGAKAALALTVHYLKERRQFGQPIGAFQAVQHQAADMAIALDAARYLTYQAVWRLSAGLPADRELATAKAAAGSAYRQITLTCHQLQGGAGYVTENDLHLYTERAAAAELWYGSRDHHLATVARQIGLVE